MTSGDTCKKRNGCHTQKASFIRQTIQTTGEHINSAENEFCVLIVIFLYSR